MVFVFSDEAGRLKSHPDCFLHAASKLWCDFSEALHVGDKGAKDINGAQNIRFRPSYSLLFVMGDLPVLKKLKLLWITISIYLELLAQYLYPKVLY